LQKTVHRIVRINYAIRAAFFAWTFFVLGIHGAQLGEAESYWVLLAASFLVYPHVVYLVARFSPDPKRTEIFCMYVDAALLGAWAGALQFPVWITYAAFFSTTLNAIAISGIPGGLWSIAAFCFGAAMAMAGFGEGYDAPTSDLVTALCFLGSVVYTCAVGWIMYQQNRGLIDARGALHESEARYRLIAENAAQLIALIDESGRWIYASPSFDRLLEREALEPGADALARVHPDDADRVRIAIVRSAASGKSQELGLRMVDRQGRVRSLKARMQAVTEPPSRDAITPALKKVVFVADDVTDVGEDTERLLLAAHALEGMTEAIMITSADGTVLTVNRAFTQITGYTREEVLGGPEKEIRNALQPPEFYDGMHQVVQRDGYWSGSTWARRKNGAVYREWRSVRAVRDEAGKPTHYVSVFYEVGASRSRDEGILKA
jgi:PAS domain S-box-containing protein